MKTHLHTLGLLLSVICLAAVFSSCTSEGNPQDGGSPGTLQPSDLLPASDEISGWFKSTGPGAYGEADDQTSLYALIDGAAELYIQHGFIEGVQQVYEGTLGGAAAELKLFISDHGDSANVAALFEEELIVPAILTPWDAGDEAGFDLLPPFDIVVYLRMDRFYLQITIDKGNDEVTALITAQAFALFVVDEVEG